jgi:SAM-dependent methyltransferase
VTRSSLAPAAGSGSFPAERLTRLAELEEWHFWFVTRRALVERLLERHLPPGPARILDLGCGTGATGRALHTAGRRVIGLDLLAPGLAARRAADPSAPLLRGSALQLPVGDGRLDAVLALDVLEHVDDAPALDEIHRVLRPGGLLMMTVPAHMWLWSYRDVASGHLRRYNRRSLGMALRGACMSVTEIRAYQFLLFPLVAAGRLLRGRHPGQREVEEQPSPRLNRVLRRINLAEVRWGEVVRWPWGSSLAAVARRPS